MGMGELTRGGGKGDTRRGLLEEGATDYHRRSGGPTSFKIPTSFEMEAERKQRTDPLLSPPDISCADGSPE